MIATHRPVPGPRTRPGRAARSAPATRPGAGQPNGEWLPGTSPTAGKGIGLMRRTCSLGALFAGPFRSKLPVLLVLAALLACVVPHHAWAQAADAATGTAAASGAPAPAPQTTLDKAIKIVDYLL